MSRLPCVLLVLMACWFFPMALPAPALSATSTDQALFKQALVASRNGDASQALLLWDRFLTDHPQDAAALSNRGNVRLLLGDAEGAIADQTRSMELSPEEMDPHLNRGTAEEALRQWDAAAADYRWILARDPAEASALYNLGNVLGSQAVWDDAAELYSQASLARPGFAMARSSEALARYQLEQFDSAERELRNLIRRYPLFADARAGLSALLWRRGQRGEAESHWAAAAGLDPRYRQAEWLLEIRRWPPQPTADLMAFLRLEVP